MLNINFLNNEINDATMKQFEIAVKFEQLDMTLSVISDKIVSLNKKIENKSGKFTVAQVEGFKSEKEELEKEMQEINARIEECKPIYDIVLAEMTTPTTTENGTFQNSETAVRNILRIIASAENTKLEKYALIDFVNNDTLETLFNAFETCHTLVASNEVGIASATKEVKKAYSEAEATIQSILKNALSLPFATPYTDKVRVKFNGASMHKLHESYVKSYSNKYNKNKKEDTIAFNSCNARTIIQKNTDKDGNVTYKYADFAKTLCVLAIEYIAK